MRPLRRTPVPPGPAGLAALIGPVMAALDGSGPAVAPVPVTSAIVSDDYVASILRAVRPDDPSVPLESDEVAVVLATSGSTGAPRGVLLTAAGLQSLNESVNGPGASPQWIAALPVSSMGGFNVLIRALDAGREPIALDSLGGAEPFTPIDFQRAVHRAAASSSDIRVSLVAAQVRRLLADDTGVEALLGCTQVLVGAGPLPAALLETATAHGIRLTRTYGATETSGGCVFDGEPLPGVSITIDEGAEGSAGEVLLSGPMLALGYRMDPASTAARFTPLGYRTGDLGTFDDDRLTLQGRIDDVVVVNGVNVALGAIERVVETLPGIESCAALAVPLGEAEVEIVLLVLGSDAIPGLRDDISQAVRAALGRPAVPRRVAVVPEFPYLPNRKLDRAALRALATEPGRVAWLP